MDVFGILDDINRRMIVANLVDMSGVSDCGEDNEHGKGEAGW